VLRWRILAAAGLVVVVAGVVVYLAARDRGDGVQTSAGALVRLIRERHGYLGGSTGAKAGSDDEGPSVLDMLQASIEQRAYPLQAIEPGRARVARAAARSLTASPAARSAETHPAWRTLGSSRFEAAGLSLGRGARPVAVSGRVLSIAVAPGCRPARCRVWVGTGGGGIFRTDKGLAQHPAWQAASTGLTSSAVGFLALDPSDASARTLYAGTGQPLAAGDAEAGSGVFRSTDGGDSWRLVPGSAAVAGDRAVTGIVIDPRDPRAITISTSRSLRGAGSVGGGQRIPPGASSAGIFRSADGGDTFDEIFADTNVIGASSYPAEITGLALDPNDPDTVYAAVLGKGIYRRSPALDGDASFHRIFAPQGHALDPKDACGGWNVVQFAVAEDGAKTRVYVADTDANTGMDSKGGCNDDVTDVWRVDDARRAAGELLGAGVNAGWTKVTIGAAADARNFCHEQCFYDEAIASPAGSPNTVWLGGDFNYRDAGYASNGRAVLRSTDGGATFSDMTADARKPPLMMHPDVHAIAFVPEKTGIAFIGSDGGVYRVGGSYVAGRAACKGRGFAGDTVAETRCGRLLARIPRRIASLNDGLPTLQFQSVSVADVGGKDEVLAGTQDNGTWSYSPRTGWAWARDGDGGQSAIEHGRPGTRFHTFFHEQVEVNFHGANPATWNWIANPLRGERSSFYIPLIADPRVSQRVFVGLQHVWRTDDSGGSPKTLQAKCGYGSAASVCGDWKPIGDDLTAGSGEPRDYVAALARAPGNSRTLWAATLSGRVFASHNAQAAPKAVTFTRMDADVTPRRFVSGLVVAATNPREAWVSFSGYNAHTPETPGHVFHVVADAATHKTTWTDLSFDLKDLPITGLARSSRTGSLYASTDFNVLRLPKDGKHWVPAGRGLPLVSVFGVTMSTDQKTLYAATHGRGIWKLPLS